MTTWNPLDRAFWTLWGWITATVMVVIVIVGGYFLFRTTPSTTPPRPVTSVPAGPNTKAAVSPGTPAPSTKVGEPAAPLPAKPTDEDKLSTAIVNGGKPLVDRIKESVDAIEALGVRVKRQEDRPELDNEKLERLIEEKNKKLLEEAFKAKISAMEKDIKSLRSDFPLSKAA